MNEPKKKAKIGLGLEPLEVAIFFAGLVVVLGLYLESGSDWQKAILHHVWPSRPITGTALVAFGVFAEVAVGLFIARNAKRSHLEAEGLIAELHERAAKAEKITADLQIEIADARERQAKAEQELIRLRALQQPRSLNRSAFISALEDKVKAVVIVWYQPNDNEAFAFSFLISSALQGAGWTAGIPEPVPDDFIAGPLREPTGEINAVVRRLPPVMRAGGILSPLQISANSIESSSAIEEALMQGCGLRTSFMCDSSLPDNTFILIVGSKLWPVTPPQA